jgi:uncharacterized protein (DUF1697 family)
LELEKRLTVYVAMLRGINVGRQKSIRMEDLRTSFEELGYHNPRTYVQSGNIIFNTPASTEEELSRKIRKKILKDYGFQVAVIIRGSAEMAEIVRANPFLKNRGIDPSKLHVTFLSDLPAKPSLSRIDQLNGPPDQFQILRQEVYLHCPNGYGRTKLTNNAIEKALSVQATTRNWNTVSTLEKMASELV